MKKTNKKGFTLIELLAVIVILALLVAIAIPAVTKYLNTSREGVFRDNAATAISAVRTYTISGGDQLDTYDIDEINDMLERKLKKSPYGDTYSGYVKVQYNAEGSYDYSIYLTDGSNCIGTTSEPVTEESLENSRITHSSEKCASYTKPTGE